MPGLVRWDDPRFDLHEMDLGFTALGRKIGKLVRPLIERDTIHGKDFRQPPLGTAVQRLVDQLVQLIQRIGGRPEDDIRASARIARGIDHTDDSPPEGEAEIPSGVIDVGMQIDIQFEPPVVSKLKQQIVKVQRVITVALDHRADL